ncbi:MAG: hypothetical protein PHG84_05985 [Endomicrobiaceae bacterium]|nr:hypothetical protein [Endomicrobiaceae bacterium]MDD3053930.1 hypothetical protein [Endomicrobiaceae bacterium]
MIIYSTKKTIEEFNIPMPEELLDFNKKIAINIIKDQENDELLKWGMKIFQFDNVKCVQVLNFATKLTIFIFDIKEENIGFIADAIAKYLLDIYSKDNEMQENLKKLFEEYPICAFSKLQDRRVIASLNHNQCGYAQDGDTFYEYIDKNILKTKQINKDFNWKYLVGTTINGKKDYIYPAEYFREKILERYNKI